MSERRRPYVMGDSLDGLRNLRPVDQAVRPTRFGLVLWALLGAAHLAGMAALVWWIR